jgi:hypothetical protein
VQHSLVEIDNEGRLKTKLYDKRNDVTFPIVNFPFIKSNIPASSVHGAYAPQLIRYYRACAKNMSYNFVFNLPSLSISM